MFYGDEKIYTKRILFIGMPDMAIVCLNKLSEKKINIVGVVPPDKSAPTHNLMVQTAVNLGYEIVTFNSSLKEPDFLNKVKSLRPDLAVVCSFNKKLPKELLHIPKDGVINLHPSKLPDYRGGNPYSHVIINGETESAITLHYMDENFDTGDIISQFTFNVVLNETMGTLFYRTNDMCASMLFEALDFYENHSFPRIPQPTEGEFKQAPTISFENKNVFIDLSKSAEEIERFIRALNPFIGAYTYYKGIILRINSASVIYKHHKYSPGSISDVNDCFRVACGKDILEIECVQFGAYFVTSGNDFVNRVYVKKGELLHSEQA